jgi:hypothetical protein
MVAIGTGALNTFKRRKGTQLGGRKKLEIIAAAIGEKHPH